MKKSVLLLAFMFLAVQLGWAGTLSGKKPKRDDDAPRLVFTGYPFGFIGSNLKVGFETPIHGLTSFCLVANYMGSEESTIYDVNNLSEFGLEAQVRFYLNKSETPKPMDGVYISPYFTFHKASFNGFVHYPASLTESATTVAFGYYFGFQKLFKSGFCLNFYGGGGINAPSGDYQELNAGVNLYTKGVRPRGGIALGFAF